MIRESFEKRFYPGPETGTDRFYQLVRSCVDSSDTVLHLGAGPATRQPVRVLRGHARWVVGLDVDPVVKENDELDEAHVLTTNTYPFVNETFNAILCDWVFEHLEDPEQSLREAARVLKPGGKLIFRTPNRNHYVALIARATPHSIHQLVANRVRGLSTDTHDPWPTHYRLNTPTRIENVGKLAGFKHLECKLHEAPPKYLVFSAPTFLLGVAYERIVSRFEHLARFRSTITGYLQK